MMDKLREQHPQQRACPVEMSGKIAGDGTYKTVYDPAVFGVEVIEYVIPKIHTRHVAKRFEIGAVEVAGTGV